MKLFNKYQSRVLQFALELMARLEREDVMPQWEIQRIASRSGLDLRIKCWCPFAGLGFWSERVLDIACPPGCVRPGFLQARQSGITSERF